MKNVWNVTWFFKESCVRAIYVYIYQSHLSGFVQLLLPHHYAPPQISNKAVWTWTVKGDCWTVHLFCFIWWQQGILHRSKWSLSTEHDFKCISTREQLHWGLCFDVIHQQLAKWLNDVFHVQLVVTNDKELILCLTYTYMYLIYGMPCFDGINSRQDNLK